MSQALINMLSAMKVTDAEPVIPSDSVDLPNGVTNGLYVGVAGNVNVITRKGNTRLVKNLTAGVFHPLRVRRVLITGTTAQDILAVY